MTEKQSILENVSIMQVALIVRDIEKTSKAFAEVFGVDVPAWSITDPMEQSHTNYRGEPTEARCKLAFFDIGKGVQLELIEPDGKPSIWQEYLDQHGEGVHHIAFPAKDMRKQVAAFEANGMPEVQRGDFTGGCYSYIDSTKQLNVLIELLAND